MTIVILVVIVVVIIINNCLFCLQGFSMSHVVSTCVNPSWKICWQRTLHFKNYSPKCELLFGLNKMGVFYPQTYSRIVELSASDSQNRLCDLSITVMNLI